MIGRPFWCQLHRVALPLHRGGRTKVENARVLVIALAANVGIAIAKFVAAAITGSSAMLTEGVHSLVDCTNQ